MKKLMIVLISIILVVSLVFLTGCSAGHQLTKEKTTPNPATADTSEIYGFSQPTAVLYDSLTNTAKIFDPYLSSTHLDMILDYEVKADTKTPISKTIDQGKKPKKNPFSQNNRNAFRMYRSIYFAPTFLKHGEFKNLLSRNVKWQASGAWEVGDLQGWRYKNHPDNKLLKLLPNLYTAFTIKSDWHKGEKSEPIEEYNLSPEFFGAWRLHKPKGGWLPTALRLGYTHESTGEKGEKSRGWDRFFAELAFKFSPWFNNYYASLYIRPWYIYATENVNKDIDKYGGNGEAALIVNASFFQIGGTFRFSRKNRFKDNPWTSVMLEATVKPPTNWFHCAIYYQYFQGYDEFLIPFANGATRQYLGIALVP